MSEPTSCCCALGGYCDRCDVLVGLDGLHVIGVVADAGGRLTITVESARCRWAALRAGSSRTVTAGSRCGWSTRRLWAAR